MSFSIYELATGRITHRVFCPDFLLDANTPVGCSAILGDYDDSLYRVNLTTHQAELKPLIPYSLNKMSITANSIDSANFVGLPSGCTVKVDTESASLPGNTFEFAVDLAGAYEITFSHPLYLDTTVTVTAT